MLSLLFLSPRGPNSIANFDGGPWPDLPPPWIRHCIPGRRALRSSATGQLLVPHAKTATRQRRAFSIVGPSTWNGLPLEMRILPKSNESTFCRLLKTDLYRLGWTGGRLGVDFLRGRLINSGMNE